MITKLLDILVMSLALPYAHMPSIFTFPTLPIKPDCTTTTAIWCNLLHEQCNLVWPQPMLASTHMWHYYRHLIILVIGFRNSTQAPHFTPHMTLLGFMCPGLGNFIRSWVLSCYTINKICCHCVKCGKTMEVTPGTPDVKSRPTRYWKGLWLQLMCCAPFRLLSQDFGMRKTEDQRLEDWSKGRSCSQSRT